MKNSIQKITRILVFLFCFSNIFGQERKMSLSEMISDIDSLVENIEQIHINPYYKFPKKKFDTEVVALKSNLKNEKNIFEYWKYVAPTIAKIEDGHTYLEIPYDEFNKTNPKVFPFAVETSLKKPYIKIVGKHTEIPDGAEIKSINGIPSKKNVQELVKYISGEDKETRAQWISYDFNFLVNIVLGIKDSCELVYKLKSSNFSKNINFISLKQYHVNNSVNEVNAPYSLKILPELNTAIIDFKSFSNPGKMRHFADSTFTEIKNKKVDRLIIDIRKNGGGNSAVGDILLQYLAKTDFRQYSDNTLIKISNQVIDKLKKEKEEILKNKKLSLNHSLYLREIDRVINSPKGKITTANYAKNITRLEIHENRFNGDLYLLTSRVTYSSAADFAQTIKAYHLGKIIGEETGGWIVCFGDSVETILPKSKLLLSLSSVKFVNQGAKTDDWHGVKPDKKIKPELALEYLLEKNNCR